MSRQSNEYFFVLYPNTLTYHPKISISKIPAYSISLFKGNHKQDQTTIIPVQQQDNDSTLLFLTDGKLQFTQNITHSSWQPIRVEVHNQKDLIGLFLMSSKEYIRRAQQQHQHYLRETVKINEEASLQFQLFVATSIELVDNLIIEHYGESDIKTPITKQSHERVRDDEFSLKNFKIVESQLYNVQGGNILNPYHDIDQQQNSVHSSNPAAQQSRYSFKIDLKEVPSRMVTMDAKQSEKQALTANEIRQNSQITWKDKAMILLFGLVSLVMIYLSMLPIRRI